MSIETKRAEDLKFATDYKLGLVTDSFGNDINGSNRLCPETGAATLVSQRSTDDGPMPDSQAHMNPALICQTGPSANDNPLNKGVDERTLAGMRNQFRRKIGAPSMSEMAARAWQDRNNILHSFPKG